MPDTTSTPLISPQAETPESEDTTKVSLGLRSLPGPLLWLLATTPVAQASALDVYAHEYVMGRDTISMKEEIDLVGLDLAFTSQSDRQETSVLTEADVANRTRLELLARLYVNQKLSTEEDARLAIVAEKVRRLIPRVTVEDFEELKKIAEESEAIRLENVERRRRLGL